MKKIIKKTYLHLLWLGGTLFFIPGFVFAGSELPVLRGIGTNFQSASTLGHDISLSDFKGKVVLLTFGFTNCPDICPITLGYLHFVFSKLTQEQQKQTEVLFITVDPETDTPEHLVKYVEQFNPRFIGVSPQPENLQRIAKSFSVSYYEVGIDIPTKYNRPIVELDNDHTAKMYNHSISIFLLDTNNRVRGTYYTGSDSDNLAMEVGYLLEDGNKKHAGQHQKLSAKNFWVRLPIGETRITAMYGTLSNQTDMAVRITGIECAGVATNSEFHKTEIEKDQAKMVPQTHLELAPKSSLQLKPLSYHAMLMGLHKNLEEGGLVRCQLLMGSESMSIEAEVKASNYSQPSHAH